MTPLTWTLYFLALRLGHVAAYLVSPDGTPAPGSTEDCSYWIEYIQYATCELIEEVYGLTAEEFEEWNPIVTEAASTCTMLPDLYYCVQTSYVYNTPTVSASTTAVSTTASTTTTTTLATSTTTTGSETSTSTTLTTTATPTPTTTTSSASISTPSPIQTGMVSDCDTFYLVVSGDSCAAIAASYDISLADFYAWNPAVGDTCSSLWVDDYVCVGVVDGASSTAVTTASSTLTSTTTTSSSGIATPKPYESGMVDDCDAFHLVVSGDDCETIASEAGITLDEFYEWNPTVGDICSSLWVDYYVCIGVE
ncbi:hypothetical protein BDV11DRAFT_175699 [Aspergillus similis]